MHSRNALVSKLEQFCLDDPLSSRARRNAPGSLPSAFSEIPTVGIETTRGYLQRILSRQRLAYGWCGSDMGLGSSVLGIQVWHRFPAVFLAICDALIETPGWSTEDQRA